MQAPRKPRAGAIISEHADDRWLPGVIVVVDPGEAERLGAFIEDALDDETPGSSDADF